MRLILWLAIWLRRLVLLSIVAVMAFGGAVGWTEYSCGGTAAGAAPPETLDTAGRGFAALPGYVADRAYESLAATLATDDPHAFGYLPAVWGYWRAACAATEGAAAGGGLPLDARIAIYGEGAGFTLHMLAKAAYEETLGRVATLVRGAERSPLDALSAEQAQAHAAATAAGADFDYAGAANALIDTRGPAPRDWERMIALNIEYRAHGLLAGLVQLPELPGAPATLRAVVTGASAEALGQVPGVSVVGPRSEGLQIETAAGAAALEPLTAIARAGGTITDIAGAATVLLAVDAPAGEALGARISLPAAEGRERQVLAVPVTDLGPELIRLAEGQARAERLLGN
jgi:hypothetical protein